MDVRFESLGNVIWILGKVISFFLLVLFNKAVEVVENVAGV